ncbi:MAG: hypothetical protein EAY75_16505 [Bacteroidetes bacterium]|nr:MAG: hypothetical protein EAY75_16505 [Bacteroidota bacterium]
MGRCGLGFLRLLITMHHIYCFSGLGADGRIFKQLVLHDAKLHFIEWTTPPPGQTLAQYAQSLTTQISHPQVVLLGVSFGGMLVTEITRLGQAGMLPFAIKSAIIVSSCESRRELPWLLRIAGRLQLHRLVPYSMVLGLNGLNRFLFDPKTKAEEMYLKRMMLKDTQLLLIKRCVHMILTWQYAQPPKAVVHVHGTADRLLLMRGLRVDHAVKGGGHFMIWNRAGEISDVVNNVLGAAAAP